MSTRAQANKPLYQIPDMSLIASLPKNGLKLVSTFSGCGGSCLGFEMQGFEVLYANEFIEAARDTYRLNHPNVYVDGRDIRQVSGDDILSRIGLSRGELDVLEGSPPCASFSTAGKRNKDWGKVKQYSDTKQRTDDLFFEFTRLLDELYPKMFVAENVSGLVKGKAKGYYLEIFNALEAKGYIVRSAMINAKWLGVPQSRERLIFIGARRDLGVVPEFPKPLDYFYTLRDALTDTPLPASNKHEATELRAVARRYSKRWYGVLQKLPKNPNRVVKGARVMNGSYFNLSRLSWHAPSDTICQMNGEDSASGNCHPDEDRKLTISELKRVCAFPDDFQLTGTFAQKWERLGRAVPPMMMRYIARAVELTLRKAVSKQNP